MPILSEIRGTLCLLKTEKVINPPIHTLHMTDPKSPLTAGAFRADLKCHSSSFKRVPSLYLMVYVTYMMI